MDSLVLYLSLSLLFNHLNVVFLCVNGSHLNLIDDFLNLPNEVLFNFVQHNVIYLVNFLFHFKPILIRDCSEYDFLVFLVLTHFHFHYVFLPIVINFGHFRISFNLLNFFFVVFFEILFVLYLMDIFNLSNLFFIHHF